MSRITRAAVLVGSERPRPYALSKPLEVADLTLDPPGAGELLIRIEAAGVCHSDLSVVDGSRPRPLPMALGHEAAGVVEEVGAGVDDVTVGDHVVLVFVPSCGLCPECSGGQPALCRRGAKSNTAGELLRGGRRLTRDGATIHHHLGVSGFATHAVVDRRSAVVVDPTVPFTVGALLGCALLTGVGAIQQAGAVRPGESVAINGLGGVGLAAVMGAALCAAHPIVAIDPVPFKRDLAVRLGATHALAPPTAVEDVRDLTGGGVDCALEAVGSAAVLRSAWDMTHRGGRTVAVGLAHPSQEFVIPALQLVAEARTLIGCYLGSTSPQRDIPRLVGLWQAGCLPVERLVDRSVPLEEINTAFDDLASGTALRRVIRPNGGDPSDARRQ